MSAPEARARENIAALPEGQAGRGVAVRESGLQTGVADYLLFADRRALGAVEAKKEGTPLAGVEAQFAKYGAGPPSHDHGRAAGRAGAVRRDRGRAQAGRVINGAARAPEAARSGAHSTTSPHSMEGFCR